MKKRPRHKKKSKRKARTRAMNSTGTKFATEVKKHHLTDHVNSMVDVGVHQLLLIEKALLHGNDITSIKTLINKALALETDKFLVAKLLLGFACIHLGRVAVLAGYFDKGITLLSQGRRFVGLSSSSLFIDLLLNETDQYSRLQKDKEAIQRWQDIACLLGENTPEYIYHRLSLAYSENKHGFGGTQDENYLWGDCHKHDVLGFLHEHLMPELYLEIGVDEGLSLARAQGRAIGVDPRPDLALKVNLPQQVSILSKSSDAFFRDQAVEWLKLAPELVFIDGMHLFEFALRDFINVERFASPTTLVVIDDIYPCHPTQALRRRRSGSWTGDIWKLHDILRKKRPDLTLVALNSFTTGLLLVCGLDPNNRILHSDYDVLVNEYVDLTKVPKTILARHGAIPSDHSLIGCIINVLRQGKEGNWSVGHVHEELTKLKQKIFESEAEYMGQAESLVGQCC